MFAHVSDVVRMILALMATPAAVGGVCNVGSDQPVSILELARRVIAVVDETRRQGDKETRRQGDAESSTPSSPSPCLPVSPSLRPPSIEFQTYAQAYGEDFEDCRRRVPDLTKLRRLTGLQARYGLDDIIRELVEWKKLCSRPTTGTSPRSPAAPAPGSGTAAWADE